jgi:hypothetical protein
VFSLARTRDSDAGVASDGDGGRSESLRTSILAVRSSIEADVWLFGDPRAREAIGEVHERIVASSLEPANAEELARVLRGRFYRRLAPQKRWFR